MATTSNRPVYDRAQLESIFLPVGQMLQLDRVCEINGQRVVCEMDVPGHWTFPMHFPSDPIFPGSLLIEAAGQAVAVWAWHEGFRGRPRMVKVNAKFAGPVLPSDPAVKLVATVRQRKQFFLGAVELFVAERKVAAVKPTIIIIAQLPLGLPTRASLPDWPDI